MTRLRSHRDRPVHRGVLPTERLRRRRHLIDHDDRAGGGERNPVKRWWWDLEMVDGVAQAPVAGVNERDLEPGRL